MRIKNDTGEPNPFSHIVKTFQEKFKEAEKLQSKKKGNK